MRMCKRKTIWLSKPLCCGILAILMFCLLVLARCQPRHDQVKTTAAIAAGQTVPVLMYHHLLPRDTDSPLKSNDIVTFTEDFAAQLGWLRDNGYHTISVAELEAFLYEGAVLPEHPIMLTFDDGYMSNYVYAAPLLREYGFTAVIFTITSQIAQDGSASSADQAVPQTREMMEACRKEADNERKRAGEVVGKDAEKFTAESPRPRVQQAAAAEQLVSQFLEE